MQEIPFNPTQEKADKIIYFDGVCNLCNASIDYIIRRDRKRIFRYVSLQSKEGQELLRRENLPSDDYKSFILEDGDKVYIKSSAALRVMRQLGGFYTLSSIFLVIPRTLRDWVYSIIANNRYKWFGKRSTCRLPSPEESELFL